MELDQYHKIRSVVGGVAWPFLPGAAGARILTLQYQYEHTQWLAPEELLALQFAQLEPLLAHAGRHCSFYRDLFRDLGINPEKEKAEDYWSRLPLLERSAVQEAGAGLFAAVVPKDHGEVRKGQTSGSTGRPVSFLSTGISRLMYMGIGLRDHFWHRRDFNGKMVAIRPEGNLEPGKGMATRGWGAAVGSLFKSGPGALMNVRTDIATQATWIRQQNPTYLHSLPTNLLALVRYCREHHIVLPELREVRTYAEQLSDELRQVCREVWNVPVCDIYSTQELGYLALQCPEHEHYHVQAESALVEIVDEAGQQVQPGEIGRVVVTPLHNYAMPLVRYLVGDYAECGPPCPCGRGLPVINKIMGRQRNMLTLPDGRQFWPSFPAHDWSSIGTIRQMQLVQTGTQQIVANLVTGVPLSGDEEGRLINFLQARFRHPFAVEIRYHDRIERSKGGKFEDFISLV